MSLLWCVMSDWVIENALYTQLAIMELIRKSACKFKPSELEMLLKKLCIISLFDPPKNLGVYALSTQVNLITSENQKKLKAPHKKCDSKETYRYENVSHLQELLQCSSAVAEGITQKNPNILYIKKDELSKVCKSLFSHGVCKTEIQKNPWLFNYFSNPLTLKLSILAKMGINESLLPLIKLSVSSLYFIANRCVQDKELLANFSNRIEYLCYHLDLNSNTMVEILLKHKVLLTMKFSHLDQIMHILKEADISAEDIVNDLWIFRHNINTMTDRICRAKQAGMPVKTWMLRCPEEIFNNPLKKWKYNQTILGDTEDVKSYLAKRLECTENYIDYLAGKNNRLLSINLPKLKKILDFLYEKGYTPEQVRMNPRILFRSLATTSQRLENFHSIGSVLPSLHLLCASAEDHKRTIENYRQKNL